jgi:hypothetical protein
MTAAAKIFNRDVNLAGQSRLVKGDLVIVDAEGNVTGGGFTGGVVPDATTFESAVTTESTVTHEGVVTHEVAPVLEAGAQIDGPIYTSALGEVGVVPFMGNTVQEVVTASGALDLGAYNHLVDTDSGALALTVGTPVMPYQRIRVQMIVDGGGGTNDATITFNGTATIVLDGVGDYFELQHNGAEWIPVSLVNLVDGSIPTYTPAV